ncbi:MAG: zinc-finger domain-containing protein [Sphingomonadales bacterium]|nr:MAG: zinc-finger domain-containing protein [Sphingomonadales bacterium]
MTQPAPETIRTPKTRIACDGTGDGLADAALGHPRVRTDLGRRHARYRQCSGRSPEYADQDRRSRFRHADQRRDRRHRHDQSGHQCAHDQRRRDSRGFGGAARDFPGHRRDIAHHRIGQHLGHAHPRRRRRGADVR